MILCSCNLLTSDDLRAAAQVLRDADPDRPVTPRRLFQAVGMRPNCGSCVDALRRTLQEWGFPATCPEPLATIAEMEWPPGHGVDWRIETESDGWEPV